MKESEKKILKHYKVLEGVEANLLTKDEAENYIK